MTKDILAIILAAGKGTRMKSAQPKVLHTICGREMLAYVLDLVKELKIKKTVVVLGHEHKEVSKYIPAGIKIAFQKRLLGTSDAVRHGLSAAGGFKGTVLLLYADIPLLKKETIEKLIKCHQENKPAATLLTAKADKPAGYGRIIRDRYDSICAIVEEKDADSFQKEIKEINTGIACFDRDTLSSALKHVRPNNRKKEYYLTDCIGILYNQGSIVEGCKLDDFRQALGINTRLDLARANKIMQQRINEKLMLAGVSIIDPDSAFIGYGAKVGKDSVIYPFTVIEKDVKIGTHCRIGPFAHLRAGTVLEDEVIAGNFLEVSRSKLSRKATIKHFGYIGDSRLGKMVNIGAGTVTANFDGKKKNITLIKDKAFIGCDTILVAPVKIGKASKTAAGAVVTRNRNVADGVLVAGVPAKPLTKKLKEKQ